MATTVTAEHDQNGTTFRCTRHGYFDPPETYKVAMRAVAGSSSAKGLIPKFMPTCPVCTQKAIKETKERENTDVMRAAKKACNLPQRFKDKNFATWQVTDSTDRGKNEFRAQAKKIAFEYAEGFGSVRDLGTCLVFSGNPGTGKTHLAAAVINTITDNGFTAIYTTGLDMKDVVQSTYRDSGATQTRQKAITGFIGPDLLVVDEIDLMHASEDAQLILWQVISGRYNRGDKPTIVISNLTRQELAEQVGDRIIDRLREGGGRHVVFNWQSHRRSK